jgi:hypothetical protein
VVLLLLFPQVVASVLAGISGGGQFKRGLFAPSTLSPAQRSVAFVGGIVIFALGQLLLYRSSSAPAGERRENFLG